MESTADMDTMAATIKVVFSSPASDTPPRPALIKVPSWKWFLKLSRIRFPVAIIVPSSCG
ncbi:GM20423 [Drosophila sechellia]|uniref:GM20423 n=1 Tax=Drosophila sechellia TaxID=7238 RepID=B4HNI9_DROSE|nr:GM20423 [Drosophila sechellia]